MSKQDRVDRSAPEAAGPAPAGSGPAGSVPERSLPAQRSLGFPTDEPAGAANAVGAVGAGGAGGGTAAAGGRVASTHWRQLLSGSSAREVLARIFQGDPLEVRSAAADVLRRRAYVLDVGRVYLRSLAYVARFAGRYRGQPELGVWLRERIDEAILDLLEEDREAARDEHAHVPDVYSELARPLGVDGGAMWRATIAFNACSPGERRAFYDWILEGGALDDLARGRGSSPTEWARQARAVLEVLLRAEGAAAVRRGDSP